MNKLYVYTTRLIAFLVIAWLVSMLLVTPVMAAENTPSEGSGQGQQTDPAMTNQLTESQLKGLDTQTVENYWSQLKEE